MTLRISSTMKWMSLLLCVFAIMASIIPGSGCGVSPRRARHLDVFSIADVMKAALEKHLRTRMIQGIPSLNVPPMDPLQLQEQTFNFTKGLAKVIAVVKNPRLHGLSNFDFTNLDFDIPSMSLVLGFFFPQLRSRGDYNITGKLFRFVPLRAKGRFEVDAQAVVIRGRAKLGFRDLMLRVTSVNLDQLELDDLKVKLEDSMSGTDFGELFSDLADSFGFSLFDLVQPKLMEVLQKLLSKELNSQLAKLNFGLFFG